MALQPYPAALKAGVPSHAELPSCAYATLTQFYLNVHTFRHQYSDWQAIWS